MRRKPVVMVGVAAVVLGVGVLAAGQAGAQEPPRGPEVTDHFDVGGGSDVGDRAEAPRAQRAAADQKHSASAAHPVHKQSKVEKPRVTTARQPAVPARHRPALSQPGGSWVAAAKEKVTAADISTSPGSAVQQQILALINQDRRQHGCGRVNLDRRLIAAADSHAADMARHNYFAHESRDGQDPGARVTHAGYRWRHYGENIARGVNSPYAVVNGWMHSPGHRHNILDCSLRQMGIGVAIAGDRYRTIYWVQDFATPM